MPEPNASQFPPAQIVWSADDPFARAVFELLQDHPDGALEALGENLCVLHTETKSLVLLRYERQLEPKLFEIVNELVGPRGPGPGLELGLIGGGEHAQQLLERSQPTRASLHVLHLGQTGNGELLEPRVLLGRGASQLARALERTRTGLGKSIDVSRAEQLKDASRVRFIEQARERAQLSALLRGRTPLGTYAILGLIGLSFLLQLSTGALTNAEQLLEMGALERSRVLDGEWWRLASSSLLHGSLMHLAFNCYVLFALGNLVERLLGTARFLVLYVLSGLAAAMGSLLLLLSAGFSVGASGAIWGLLGAEAALAFGPRSPLPPSVRQSAKRATVVNLLINTAVSFLPRVDWAGHFAGGIAGAVLVFSGLLLPAPRAARGADSPSWTGVAMILSLAFFGAALYGVSGASSSSGP